MAQVKLTANIKYLRLRNGLTQDKLAANLKVKRSLYESWESGRSEPQSHHLPILSRYFNVSIDYLVRQNLPRLSNKAIAKNWVSIKSLLDF